MAKENEVEQGKITHRGGVLKGGKVKQAPATGTKTARQDAGGIESGE